MATHYLYEEQLDKTSICQGDVLRKTPDLLKLLNQVHPHYASHPSYTYFLVITQSCDLVRRDGTPPSARYITIAAVRPVEEAILREAKGFQQWWQQPTKVIDSKSFDKLMLFVQRLLDNNEPNYFYIHEDSSLEIHGRNCAFLALSIALRIDHYDLCLDAKIAQIKDPFRAKLGWLVGNMYSRVGTEEWNDYYGRNDSSRKARDLLKDLLVCIDKEKIDNGIASLASDRSLDSIPPAEIFDYINQTKIVSRQKLFSDRLKNLLTDNLALVDPMCSRLIQEITKDNMLLSELQKVLSECGAEDMQNLPQKISGIITNVISSTMKESTFPGRQKIINNIFALLTTDTVLRDIILH